MKALIKEIRLWLGTIFLGWAYDILPNEECKEAKLLIVKSMFKIK